MSIEVKVNKEQLAEFKKRLKAAREDLSNNLPAMRQVAAFLDQWVQKNFMGRGSNVGGWAPFTYGGRLTTKKKSNAQSIDGKRYVNGSAVLLQDTGTLRHSFLPFVRLGVAGIGSDLPYSAHHNDDDAVVQRRLLPKEEEVLVDVNEILDNFVMLRVRKTNA